jgi:hypothetical protein
MSISNLKTIIQGVCMIPKIVTGTAKNCSKVVNNFPPPNS